MNDNYYSAQEIIDMCYNYTEEDLKDILIALHRKYKAIAEDNKGEDQSVLQRISNGIDVLDKIIIERGKFIDNVYSR